MSFKLIRAQPNGLEAKLSSAEWIRSQAELSQMNCKPSRPRLRTLEAKPSDGLAEYGHANIQRWNTSRAELSRVHCEPSRSPVLLYSLHYTPTRVARNEF